jgi:uncharacterized protein (DUF2147 family)
VFRLFAAALVLCAALPGFGHADAGGTPTGRWLTANRQAVIQIAPCGAELCGQIVGLATAHPGDHMPTDWQGQPQCGLTIMETAPGTDGDGAKVWQGSVLDPRDGSVYHAEIKLDGARHLYLHGYIGLPIFGQTQTWTPYAGRTLANCRLATANASAG